MNSKLTASCIVLLIQFGWSESSIQLHPGGIGPGRCGMGIFKTSGTVVGGGERTSLKDYPWTALLIYRRGHHPGEDFFDCGGSLISNRYVLTAAHCVHGLNETYTLDRIRLGEWDLLSEKDCVEALCNDPPKDVGVENIIKHDKFSKKAFHNDIALIKLNESISFTRTVSPICLPKSNDESISVQHFQFTIIGWGATEHRNGTKHFHSRYKVEVDLPGVHISTCTDHYKHRELTGSQMCAGGELGKDACQGDSGGGLVSRKFGLFFAFGVVSYGHEICELGFPGVYTKVASHLDWIDENTD